jgi:hypothetical protein
MFVDAHSWLPCPARAAGERCLGKSTLIETLFGEAAREPLRAGKGEGSAGGHRAKSTLSMEQRTVELTEAGVAIRLTVVDTPGAPHTPLRSPRIALHVNSIKITNRCASPAPTPPIT